MPQNKITVLKEQEEWSTNFNEEIVGVMVNGRKINDVHDLTEKVIGMTKTIRILAITATTLALMAVIAISLLGKWLISNESSIQRLLLTSKHDYNKIADEAKQWRSHQRQRAYVHLQEFHGLHWDDGMQDWVNHSMVKHSRLRNKN